MSHFSSTADLDAFRCEVRAFLQTAVPEDIRRSVQSHCLVTREQAMRWQRILHERGWAAAGWPVEHGGTGWSLVQQAIFREEMAACPAPRYENLGIDTIGPTIMRHGTPEQKSRFLPRMLSFEDYWAQGYSEPDAGSDLASLRTVARREGDHFVVSGTKIWQSYGHWADWALVLVRSDAGATRKQDGISVLLIDLKAPGVSIRPIRFINGATFHVQMFFDEVRVPVENLVGQEHAGWSVAKGLLVTERLFVARVAECRAALQETVALAQGSAPDGGSLLAQDVYARRLAELDIRTRALEAAWWPTIRAVEDGQEPALEASLIKLQGNEVLQDVHQLQLDLLGTQTLAFDPEAILGTPSASPLAAGHVNNLPLHVWRYRGITLGGGTSEVQRGIVAKAIFSAQTELEQPMVAGLSDQQAMLDDGLRRLLADRYDFDQRRAIIDTRNSFDESVWTALADMGLTGLLAPERDGGFGGQPIDLMPVMEALGESLVVEPLLWNAWLPTQLLLHASDFAGRGAALTALVEEGARTALAHEEGSRDFATTAFRDGEGWRLVGAKRLVLGGDCAQRLLISARPEGGGMALFDCGVDWPGVIPRRYTLHDGRGAADFRFESLWLPASALVAGPERAGAILEEALALATLTLCADSVGAMRRALALTVEYMRTRKQFGRSLADYQALQHRVVEHFRRWVDARTLMREAAAGWPSASPAERAQRIAAAKWMAGRAGRAIALDSLQLHGAIGLQDETAVSHYAKRLVSNDMLLGDSTQQLARFIAAGQQAL